MTSSLINICDSECVAAALEELTDQLSKSSQRVACPLLAYSLYSFHPYPLSVSFPSSPNPTSSLLPPILPPLSPPWTDGGKDGEKAGIWGGEGGGNTERGRAFRTNLARLCQNADKDTRTNCFSPLPPPPPPSYCHTHTNKSRDPEGEGLMEERLRLFRLGVFFFVLTFVHQLVKQ